MPGESVYLRSMPFDPLFAASFAACLILVSIFAAAAAFRRKARKDREIEGLIRQDQYEYTILDVRRRADFEDSHMPDSRNIPYDEFDGGLPTENMFEKIFVCGPNRRIARRMAKILERTGYFNVTCYGSFRKWKGSVVPGGSGEIPDGGIVEST
jgi:rhodanese-related sulfurtransferase